MDRDRPWTAPRRALIVSIAAGLAGAGCARAADPNPVTPIETSGRWQLQREGKPYLVKGAGGGASRERLKATGANSLRLWDAENSDAVLDEAHRLGLTVTLGIWLGQERQGFNYNDAEQVSRQQERVRSLVLRYKDHPAVLVWGLGNEMEGSGDNAAVWSAINNLAAMVKRLDPNHPTMTVLAELGGNKVRNLHRLCPDIDIVGINTYAGAESVAKRYAEAGGAKPFMLTEFGPPGTWEVAKTPWGAVIEPTSTEKAAWYRRAYTEASKSPLYLGSYAFTWGSKQEATATWFGMLLPDGSRLAAVDTMQELWTGKPPANRVPEIRALRVDGPVEVDPGGTVRATLNAADPEGGPLKVEWVLRSEAARYGVGGDAEAAPPEHPEAIVKADSRSAEVRMPAEPGGYRLFTTIRDGQGGAAVANAPLRVKGEVRPAEGRPAQLPLVVYDEAGRKDPPFVPTGWMGDTQALRVQDDARERPFAGATCLRIAFTAPTGWGGVVWQSPANDWGDLPGGVKLTGAKRLVFHARGEAGGEVATFQFGLLGPDKRFPDTAKGSLENVALTSSWKEYAIDLAGKDLSRIKTGFACILTGNGRPVAIYLDSIRFE